MIHEQLQSLAVPISSVQMDPHNARIRTQKNLEALKSSLTKYGQRKAIVVHRSGIILAGNGTFQAAKELGWDQIAAITVDDDDQAAAGFAIADNRTGELSEWDEEELLEQLKDQDDPAALGFDEGDLDDLLNPIDQDRAFIKDLKSHPRNYQEHPDDQLQHIVQSIETHGFYRAIVVAKDNTILAGHGVVAAATKMGLTRVPIIRLNLDPMEPRALKVLTSDNEINNLAIVDERALSNMLREIMDSEEGLIGTGFDDQQLTAMMHVTRTEAELQDKTTDEWVGLPSFKPIDDPLKLMISFQNEADRAAFVEKHQIEVAKKETVTWTTWYPYRPKQDLKSLKFEAAPEIEEQA